MSPLPRLFLRTMGRTGGQAALWAWLLISAGSLAQWLTLVRPTGAHATLLLVGAVTLSSSLLAVEVAMVAGPAAAVAALRVDGSWLGLRSVGARGRDLLGPLLVWTGVLGALALLDGHLLVPVGRVWLREAETEAAVGLRLREDQATTLGPWALAAAGEGLRFAGETGSGTVTGEADRAEVRAAKGAVELELGAGEAHDVAGTWSVRFRSMTTALPVGEGARVQVGERSTAELLARTLAPYERWILWKRTLVPLALGALALVGLPLGARVRAGPGVGALGVAFWAVLRVSDVLAQGGAVWGAALALVLPAAVTAALAWRTWADR